MPKLIVINFPFNYLIYLISYQTCFFTWTGGSDRNFFGSDRNRTDLFTLLGLVMEDLPVLDLAQIRDPKTYLKYPKFLVYLRYVWVFQYIWYYGYFLSFGFGFLGLFLCFR